MVESLKICLVLGEQQIDRLAIRSAHEPPAPTERLMFSVCCACCDSSDRGVLRIGLPRPVVPIPEMRQDMNRGGLRTTIYRGNAAEDVFGVRLGIFNEQIEIAIGQKGL